MKSNLQEFIRKNLGKVYETIAGFRDDLNHLNGRIDQVAAQSSINSEIFEIEGRPLAYNLTGEVLFTAQDQGQRGTGIIMEISQDGPFIQTHYPVCMWRPTLPANAENLGMWRPVNPYPLDTQAAIAAVPIDLNSDIISISYEMADSGSERNLQNAAILPLLSPAHDPRPLPVWNLYTPNATLTFTPTYNAIRFNNVTVAPTQGSLQVVIPGFRIVNM